MRCDSRILNANDVVNLAFGYGEIKKVSWKNQTLLQLFFHSPFHALLMALIYANKGPTKLDQSKKF